MNFRPTLHMPRDLVMRLLEHFDESAPQEACGLLVGTRDGHISKIVESENKADNPETTFEIDVGLRLRVQRQARADGMQIVGHYHSHPTSAAWPSERDISLACEPDLVWLIAGRPDDGEPGWEMSAFFLDEARFSVEPVMLEILEEQTED